MPNLNRVELRMGKQRGPTASHLRQWISALRENHNANEPGMGAFTKYVGVLGLGVYAESGSGRCHGTACGPYFKLDGTDNDEDGEVDDQALWAELLAQKAMVPVFNGEGSAAEEDFFDNYRGNGVSAVLYNNEIDPSRPGYWGADATVEEIAHHQCGGAH